MLPGGAAHHSWRPGSQKCVCGRQLGLQSGRLWPTPATQGQCRLGLLALQAAELVGVESATSPTSPQVSPHQDDIYSLSSGSKIPVKWTVPEVAHYCVYSQKSDFWSFGVLLYEVFSYGQCPYEGEPPGSLREVHPNLWVSHLRRGTRPRGCLCDRVW